MNRPSDRSRLRMRHEELEPRNMLAGHGFAAAFMNFSALHASSAATRHSGVQAAAVSSGSQVAAHHHVFGALAHSHHSSSASSETTLTATLTDSSGGTAAGTVKYQTGSLFGVTVTVLTVNVTGATPNSPLDVTLTIPDTTGSTSGTVVDLGPIMTDSTGAGTLVLSSSPSSGQIALPSNFPTTLAAGATITAGTLSGTLAASTSTGEHHGCHGDDDSSGSGTSGTGTSGTGTTGTGTTGTGTTGSSSSGSEFLTSFATGLGGSTGSAASPFAAPHFRFGGRRH